MNKDSTVTEITKKTTKKKKVQGKLDREMIFKLYTQKLPPTKLEIAKESGSLGNSDSAMIQSVSNVINSSKFQIELEEHKRMQKVRALARVQKAERLIDYEVMAADQKVLGGFLIANEKLLHESVKVSSEDERDKQKETRNTDNMTTSEIEAILETKKKNIARLKETIEGVIVK